MKEVRHSGHMLYDSFYVKCSEESVTKKDSKLVVTAGKDLPLAGGNDFLR